MKIIKLNTVNSTSSFLKDLVLDILVEDFTIVVAKTQTTGRGQVDTSWVSESGKNLTFSIFCKYFDLPVNCQKYLNFAVSISVLEAINEQGVLNLSIKWPNDILAGNKKIAGILIENSLKSMKIAHSIIGVGLNVNQEFFPSTLPNASSIKNCTGNQYDLDVLLKVITTKLKENILLLNTKKYEELEAQYLKSLYKKNVPTMFKNSQNILFMGKILGVSIEGKIQIELENETVQEFGLKEVSFASL